MSQFSVSHEFRDDLTGWFRDSHEAKMLARAVLFGRLDGGSASSKMVHSHGWHVVLADGRRPLFLESGPFHTAA